MSYILNLSLYSFILYDNKIHEEHCKLTTNEPKKEIGYDIRKGWRCQFTFLQAPFKWRLLGY